MDLPQDDQIIAAQEFVLVNLIAMGMRWGDLQGQAFGVFVLVIAAVEAGLGLAIVVMLFRRRGTLDAERWNTMRG